jgi:transcriptional regulator with XRE-family HTH domain
MAINNGNGSVKTPYKEALVSLGERVLLWRRRSGFDQEQLAVACNDKKLTTLTQQRISDIECGKTEATWLEVQAIADVMSKDLNEFRV